MKKDQLDLEINKALDARIESVSHLLSGSHVFNQDYLHLLEVWRGLIQERRIRQKDGYYREEPALVTPSDPGLDIWDTPRTGASFGPMPVP